MYRAGFDGDRYNQKALPGMRRLIFLSYLYIPASSEKHL